MKATQTNSIKKTPSSGSDNVAVTTHSGTSTSDNAYETHHLNQIKGMVLRGRAKPDHLPSVTSSSSSAGGQTPRRGEGNCRFAHSTTPRSHYSVSEVFLTVLTRSSFQCPLGLLYSRLFLRGKTRIDFPRSDPHVLILGIISMRGLRNKKDFDLVLRSI